MRKPLLLVGAGGHCRSCMDVIEAESVYRIAGLVDAPERVGQTVAGYTIVGCDDDLSELMDKYGNALVTVGQIKTADVRKALFERLTVLEAVMVSPVSPLAYVSSRASVGEGSIVMHQALVNSGAAVGRNCIINTKALLEHDVEVGDHCHIATGAVVNGDCKIGPGVFVGSNSCCRQGTTIGEGAVISAGVFVREDVPPGAVVTDA